jgi:arylsulfatase
MAVYAAQIDRMDQGIGRILRKLRELDIEDNTLVLFLSDNGGCAELLREDGQRAREWPKTREGQEMRFGNIEGLMPGDATTYQSYDLPWANASNTPFRLYKHWVHEGGIATPLIAYWPQGISVAGGINHAQIHVADFMATCLDVAGIAYPEEYNEQAIQSLEGESFFPALRGEDWARERPIVWEHEGNCAVRDGRWKLVKKYPGDWELYDMVEDRTELNDLSAANKPQVAKMVATYDAWAERCGVIPWQEILARR